MAIQKWSSWIVPLVVFIIFSVAFVRKTAVYDCFLEGVKDGMKTVVAIFPAILAIYVAVAMLKTSGLLSGIAVLLRPITSRIAMPEDILPLALLRPVSGSGAIGLVNQIIAKHGPDSLIGITACVMSASTETTFYTLAMYFGAARVRKTSYALAAALWGDVISIVASLWICRMFFYK